MYFSFPFKSSSLEACNRPQFMLYEKDRKHRSKKKKRY
jgi:hypothetical protein